MSTKITLGGKQAIRHLATTSDELRGKGDDQLDRAGESVAQAADSGRAAASSAVLAHTDAIDAMGQTVTAAGHTLSGAALAAAGALVKAAEHIGDLLGAALQKFGKALIHVGNFVARLGGGTQYVVKELTAEAHGMSRSDRLLQRSREQFSLAGRSLERALADLVSSGGNLGNAALAVLEASTHIAGAAAHAGSGATLHASALAVDAARVALDAVQHGTDGAGALLQEAGKAVVAASNALNTAGSTDTAVVVKP